MFQTEMLNLFLGLSIFHLFSSSVQQPTIRSQSRATLLFIVFGFTCSSVVEAQAGAGTRLCLFSAVFLGLLFYWAPQKEDLSSRSGLAASFCLLRA